MSTPLTFRENSRIVVNGVVSDVSSPGACQAVGIGLRRVVREWLRDLDQNRPARHTSELPGSQPTHYYSQAAKSVTAPQVSGNKVTISITQVGFRQRLLGGDIGPRNAKYLTLPASGLSYGARAREFTDLKFALVRDDNGFLRPALVNGDNNFFTGTVSGRRRGKKKSPLTAGDVVFWLVRHVSQEPDPGVLPGPDYLVAGAVEGLRAYLRRRGPTQKGESA